MPFKSVPFFITKNNNTKEVWGKGNATHSDKKGEWKVGIGRSESMPKKKIIVGGSDGEIIKIDKWLFSVRYKF